MRVMGFARTVIYDWLNKYRAGGIEALRALPIPGRPPKLTEQQRAWVYRTVTQNNPLQLQFEFALWTRAMVRDLIRQNCGVTLSLASVGRLLRSLGLTPQRPVRRAIEQVPAKVREWLTVDYPAIQAKARKAGAQIFFADEAGVRSNSHHSGTTWAPMGQTPVVPATGKRFGLNLVSAVSPQGVLRFMVVDGRMTAVRFIAFLKRLLHNQTRPIFLIVDQHSSHRAKAVQEFVASTDGHLELFFLPPYSPELNPDELGVATLSNGRCLDPRGCDKVESSKIDILVSWQQVRDFPCRVPRARALVKHLCSLPATPVCPEFARVYGAVVENDALAR